MNLLLFFFKQGNSHIVFNGSFYYYCRDFGMIIRYDFEKKQEVASRQLPNVATSGDHYLYTTKHNYVDLNVDDNGIWAIYTTIHSSHTNVVKVMIENFMLFFFLQTHSFYPNSFYEML